MIMFSIRSITLIILGTSMLGGCQFFKDKHSYTEGAYKQAKEEKTLVWPKGFHAAKFSTSYGIPKVHSLRHEQTSDPYPKVLREA